MTDDVAISGQPADAICAGDIVRGLDPTELVEVTRVGPFGPKTLIEGFTVNGRRQIKRPLTQAEVKGVAVFTNATCDPTQGRITSEGVHTRTLWGEIACQLGGPTLYEKVRPNHEAMRVPQGLFLDVLREAAPCLILLDELADYCVGAAAVPVGETTLADQTISFIQQLTEAVQQVPGAVVVATLPASKEEVANSEKGQEAFVTLEKRFQRLGADVEPVADDEIYAVVRTRLFERITSVGEEDYPARVASAYDAMYSSHASEVPGEASKSTIKEQIEQAYPFHPSLIDALYQRWGAHPDFQRTRGVLRLLASIIDDLWEHRSENTQSQPLIQPCHVRWTIDAMNAALTRLWGPAFQAVVAADVAGPKTNASAFDQERGNYYDREKIAQGIAAAILLGSFGGQGERSGFSGKDLKYVCSRPGLNWNYTEGVFVELENRCFFLHTAAAGSLGKRYWFGAKPTLNKRVVQYRQQYSSQSFDQEIEDALKSAVLDSMKRTGAAVSDGPTWRPLVGQGSDLAEQKNLTLLILPPSRSVNGEDGTGGLAREAALATSRQCGGKDRLYRNTLLFLAPTSRGLTKLRQAHRELATLNAVHRDYNDRLDPDQKDDLKKRRDAAAKAAVDMLGPAYTVALRVKAGDTLESVTLSDTRPVFGEHLGYLWQTLVRDEEWILRTVGEVTLKETGLIPDSGALRVKDAVEAFLKFTDKPMVATRGAVTTGLSNGCERGVIGIARGATPASFLSRTCGKPISIDPTEEGLWIIPPFKEEIQTNSKTAPEDTQPQPPPYTRQSGPDTAGAGDTGTGGHTSERKIRRFCIQGAVPAENWSEIFRCFIVPTTKMGLKRQSLGINFELQASDGAPIDPVASMLPIICPAEDRNGKKIRRQLSPDAFLAWAPDHRRASYDLDVEPAFPAFVLEVVSPSSVRQDEVEKVAAYEVLGAAEYALFTPGEDGVSTLKGYQRGPAGRFESWQPDDAGRLWSAVLELWLVVRGELLRAMTWEGVLLPTRAEDREARQRAEDAERRAEEVAREALQGAERLEAELAAERAESARLRALQPGHDEPTA